MSPLPDASLQVIFAADEAPITELPGHQNSAPTYMQQTQTTPSAGPTYIQQAQSASYNQGAAPAASSAAASAAASWQSYTPYGDKPQENADPAASAWQKQSGW
eukprot:1660734-Amphidinium_carterae.1